MKRALFIVSLGVVLGASGVASAWQGLDSSNPHWTGTVPYSLNSAGSADLGGFAASESVVRQGLDDWTRVSCSALTTEYQGSSGSAVGSRNVIGWHDSGTWPYDPNAIGVTTPRFTGSTIVDASMELNGIDFVWTTAPGSGTTVNAYSIVLHEGGHYHGLGHSMDSRAAMYYAYSGGVLMISPDDEAGICALYPGGGGGTTDCTTTGCPTGQVCDTSGMCVDEAPVSGTGGTCDACTSDSACSGVCLQYPDGSGHCGNGCSTDADCGGSNESCEAVSDGSRRCIRRRPSDGAATCAIEAGSTSPDPTTGGTPDPTTGECTTSRDCASSELCNADAQCVPVPGGALGDACEGNADCDSGLCAVDSGSDQTFCTQLCDGTSGCPSGFSCEPVGGGMSVCSPGGGTMGTGTGTGSTGTGSGAPPAASPYSDGLEGGCSATGAPSLPAPIALSLLLLIAIRRRR